MAKTSCSRGSAFCLRLMRLAFALMLSAAFGVTFLSNSVSEVKAQTSGGLVFADELEVEFLIRIRDAAGATPGYRDVVIQASTFSGRPSKRERVLEIEYEEQRIYGWRGMATRKEVTIPKNAVSGSTEFRIPVMLRRDRLPEIRIRVFEDGEELTGRFLVSDARPTFAVGDSSYSCLLVDAAIPKSRGTDSESMNIREELITARRRLDSGQTESQVKQMQTGSAITEFSDPFLANVMTRFMYPQEPGAISGNRSLFVDLASESYAGGGAIHPDDFPTEWTQLSTYDAIAISLPQLVALHDQAPEKFAALRRWLRTDRMLITNREAGELKAVEVLEELFAWEGSRRGELEWVHAVPTAAGQKQATGESAGQSSGPLDQGGLRGTTRTAFDFDAEAQISRGMQIRVADEEAKRDAAYLVGKDSWHTFVLVDDDSPEQFDRAHRLFLDFGFRYFSSHDTRLGYELHGGTERTLDWLVEGYGLPPVRWFQVLITAFVIFIGPINYVVLRYLRRIHLMLFTVPFGSGLICVALFGATAFSDGFVPRSRILSFSIVDQVNDEALLWSRESYFTPSIPESGFNYPSDTVALPFARARSNVVPFECDSSGGGMNYQKGSMRGRTTSQFLVSHSSTTPAEIEIVSQNAEQIEAVNRFPVSLTAIGIVDEEGRIFRAENVSSGETFVAELAGEIWLSPTLGRATRERAPSYPDGMEPGGPVSRQRTLNDSGLFRNMGQLGFLVQEMLDKEEFEPKTYWFIADGNPLVSSPIPDVQSTQNLHLVKGYW